MKCTRCDAMDCYRGKEDCSPVRDESAEACRDPDTLRVMGVAAAIEAEGYGRLNRIEEIAEYAERTGVRRLGLAFCIGLADEARALAAYYRSRGFIVHEACCKLGGLSKEELGLSRLHPEWESEATCNPIGQALELARCRTDLNLVVGLCVGHDILFQRHSVAPSTTVLVKDRVLGHAPALALYSGYGRRRLGI